MKATFRSRLADAKGPIWGRSPLWARRSFSLSIRPATAISSADFARPAISSSSKPTGRYQGPMAFDTFTKIIDDLQAFREPVRVLRLYKEGEPLMNKRFAEMVGYARRSDKIVRIDTTTNGVLLTPKTSEKVIAAGIDQINISVNGIRNEQFVDLVKTKVNFERYVENIKYLHSIRGNCEIYVKAIKENLSEDDQKRFLGYFWRYRRSRFFRASFSQLAGIRRRYHPERVLGRPLRRRSPGAVGLPLYFLQHDHQFRRFGQPVRPGLGAKAGRRFGDRGVGEGHLAWAASERASPVAPERMPQEQRHLRAMPVHVARRL